MSNRAEAPWDHLLILLGEMHAAFEQFLSFLCDEERLLVAMDRQGVGDMAEKKEQALVEMSRYEQQVSIVIQQLAGPEHQGKVDTWLKQSHHPQAMKASTIFHELIGFTQKIQSQGRKNEILIRRMQCVVREAINLIYTGLGTGPVYQGSGALQFSTAPSSMSLHG